MSWSWSWSQCMPDKIILSRPLLLKGKAVYHDVFCLMAKTFQIHGIEVAGMKPFTCMRLQLIEIRPLLQSRALSVDISYEGGIVHIENKEFHLLTFPERVFTENLK
jgi:hypothetical protein